MKNYRILFIFLIGLFSLSSPLSQSRIDSLSIEYEKTHSITTGQLLVAELMNENNDSAIILANEIRLLSIDEKDPENESQALDNLGEIYRRLGKMDSAVNYLNQAVKLKLDNQIDGIHDTYNILGKTYANQGNYDQSAESFLSALYIMEENEDLEGQAFYLNNLGIVFDIQGIYDKALEYYQRSLDIKLEADMQDALAASYNNIAIVYFNLDQYNNSLEYHTKALEENIRMDKTRSIARSYNNIGFAHIYLQQYDKAILNLNNAFEIRNSLNDARAIAQTSINLATAYKEMAIIDSAIYFANYGTQLADSIGAKEILDDGYSILSEIFQVKENYKEALHFFQLHSALQDTLRNEDAFASIAEMEAKYNLLKKQKEISQKDFEIERSRLLLENKQAAQKLYISLLIGSLLVSLLLFFRYYQKKRISKLLLGQNALIKKQNQLLEADKLNLNKELSDKNQLLNKVYTSKKDIELPPELLALSKREMEVLSYLALGWTDQQISDKLFVSKSTTKTHLRRIYSKLLVKGRAGAVAIAHQHNIIGGLGDLEQ